MLQGRDGLNSLKHMEYILNKFWPFVKAFQKLIGMFFIIYSLVKEYHSIVIK